MSGGLRIATARQAVLRRRIRLLVAATITYNVVEAVVALAAGTVASSVALIGFGLDSVIEVSSAAAVAWQFAGADPERRERMALRVIACSFFALAAYVSVEAVRALLGGGEADRCVVGIVLVAVSVVVMRRAGGPQCVAWGAVLRTRRAGGRCRDGSRLLGRLLLVTAEPADDRPFQDRLVPDRQAL